MPCNRRQFLQQSAAILCTAGISSPVRASSSDVKLPIPPLLEATPGQPLFLTLQQCNWAFLPNAKTEAWGINGQYLGPTIRVKRDDDIKLVYSNRLNESVAMTVSGLLVPGPLIGGATRMISPGGDWSPVLPVRQPAANCWYHANTPNRTAQHVYQGLAGMWLIEDQTSRQLRLPKHYGVDDLPLIIRDKRLSNFGAMEYTSPGGGGFFGNHLLVNGVQSPFVEVSRGWVRLRLLNASNARRYQLQLNDGSPLYVIGGDLGLLPAPVSVNKLSLAPGERRDVLIDMTGGKIKTLVAGDPASWLDRLRGLLEPSDQLINTDILQLRPTGLLPLVTDNLADLSLVPLAVQNQPPAATRTFQLGEVMPGINNQLWDMSRIDFQVQQNSTELWKIRSAHPQAFHIEGAAFLIKKVNGVPPLAEDSGWKDTLWVDGEVELQVYFSQPTAPHFPFRYYSQALEMADRGSAGQFSVIPAS